MRMTKTVKQKIYISLITLLSLLIILLLAGGWYFSDMIEKDGLKIDHSEDPLDLIIVDFPSITGSGITLTNTETYENDLEDLRRYSRWGLVSESAHGYLNELISENPERHITRKFTVVSGKFKKGDLVRLDRNVFSSPTNITGVKNSKTITIEGPLGPLRAWLIPPYDQESLSNKWAILVHGRTADKEEALRTIPAFAASGFTTLVINYRNDPGTTPDPSGYYQFGRTEWEDIEPFVKYATENNGDSILLGGFSMGGSIIVNFMLNSVLADEIDLLFLNSPMLNFGSTVDLGARERGVPNFITWTAKLISSLRFSINWKELNYLTKTEKINIPILLIHGDKDDTVPVETSRELARQNPELVNYFEFKGASHVASWNSNPELYEQIVKIFLLNH